MYLYKGVCVFVFCYFVQSSDPVRDFIPEPEFANLLRSPGIDSQAGGPVRQPYLPFGQPGYIGWRNRFLGIDSWAPQMFTNSGSAIRGDIRPFPFSFQRGRIKKISGSRPQIAWIGSLMGLVYHYSHFPPYRGQYTTHRNSTNIYI